MKEEKLGHDIYGFTKGDVLTRVQRGFKIHYQEAEYGSETPKAVKFPKWADHMGKPVIYHGIFNNQIHVQPQGKGKIETLSLEEFAEGWDYYEVPKINLPVEEKNDDEDRRNDNDGPGVKIHKGVIVGEPPEFIKRLLGGKNPFEEPKEQPQMDMGKVRKAFSSVMEEVFDRINQEQKELDEKLKKDFKHRQKMVSYMDFLYLTIIGLLLIVHTVNIFYKAIPQNLYNNLFLLLIVVMYAHVKLDMIKKVLNRTEQSTIRLKSKMQKREKESTDSTSRSEAKRAS